MEDNRKEQREALETLMGFNERLLKNMKILVKELSGARLEDTDQFLKSIIDAINWEVQVMNGTMSLLNEGKQRIHKEEFNTRMVAVSDSIKEKDDAKIAKTIQELIPEFESLEIAAQEVLGKE